MKSMLLPTELTEEEVQIPALVDCRSKMFERCYQSGLICALARSEESSKPLLDREIFVTLQYYITFRQDVPYLYCSMGYYLGMLHGAVLSPDGTVRPGVDKLVTLSGPDFAKGYRHGRGHIYYEGLYFQGIESTILKKHSWTDKYFVHTIENMLWETDIPEDIRYYEVGYVLGQLSVHVFPYTKQETRRHRKQSLHEELLRAVGNNCFLYSAI